MLTPRNRPPRIATTNDRNRLLTSLRNARSAHQRWLGQALVELEGVRIEEKPLILDARGCEFGQWYYGQGAVLSQIPGFNEIALLHDRMHAFGQQIRPFIESSQTTMLSRLFGPSSSERSQKRMLVEQLTSLSKRIVALLNHIEKALGSLSDTEMAALLDGRGIYSLRRAL